MKMDLAILWIALSFIAAIIAISFWLIQLSAVPAYIPALVAPPVRLLDIEWGGSGRDDLMHVMVRGKRRRYFGSSTVWHCYETGKRQNTLMEAKLNECWMLAKFKREQGESGWTVPLGDKE